MKYIISFPALAIVIAGGFMVSPLWVVCCGGQG